MHKFLGTHLFFPFISFSVHYTHFRDSCHSYSDNWNCSSENPSSYLIPPFQSCWCDNKEKQKNHADFAHYRFDVWCSLVAVSYLHDRRVFFVYYYYNYNTGYLGSNDYFHPNWAGLAVLFSRKLLKGTHDFFQIFSIAFFSKNRMIPQTTFVPTF